MQQLWHKRLRHFEAFDKIELSIEPRYKTSGLSGDEWRQSVVAHFYFKGEAVFERSYRDMQTALLMLGTDWIRAQEPIPERVIEIEKTTCDQPSCNRVPEGRYLLKRETSDRGEWLDASEQRLPMYRKFCKKHARRGDCGREDADGNYSPLDTLTPDESTNTVEAPATYGGAFVMDGQVGGEPEVKS